MYETALGNRVLAGAERQLYIESLSVVAEMLEDEQSVFGVSSFDQLTHGSKVATVFDASRALLCHRQIATKPAAYIDSAIVAIFRCCFSLIQMEIDEFLDGNPSYSWRRLVRQAVIQSNIKVPHWRCEIVEEWEIAIDALQLKVVRNEFAADHYLDLDPRTAKAAKLSARLPDDYFVKVSRDPPERHMPIYLEAIRQFSTPASPMSQRSDNIEFR